MTSAYVVKTGDTYLYNGEDGDIGLGPEIGEAKRFVSREEATEAANEYTDSGYEIIAVEIVEG